LHGLGIARFPGRQNLDFDGIGDEFGGEFDWGGCADGDWNAMNGLGGTEVFDSSYGGLTGLPVEELGMGEMGMVQFNFTTQTQTPTDSSPDNLSFQGMSFPRPF